uniref:hypothetical protein n=1 Tax=Salmonella enterica TaxID=28901 RepID=UPI00398C516D
HLVHNTDDKMREYVVIRLLHGGVASVLMLGNTLRLRRMTRRVARLRLLQGKQLHGVQYLVDVFTN